MWLVTGADGLESWALAELGIRGFDPEFGASRVPVWPEIGVRPNLGI